MAEVIVFSLASKILLKIASPAFEKAYEKGLSIWEAKKHLAKLKVSIQTIQAVLLDAEKRQESSAAVKDWIKRVKSVLYDADDLFDEVATDDLLKQQMMEGKDKLSLKNKVRVSCSKLNSIVSRNSIAKQVKAIRKSLLEISNDMAQFEFVRCSLEEPVFGVRGRQDPGCFVDAKNVVGRKHDKKVILGMLFDESSGVETYVPVVIAIVGIAGMGKTTLAQLIFNDDEVERGFGKKWFACISDTSDEKEVLGKIFQSISNQSYSEMTVSQLHTGIRESVKSQKFLLVLDDVWDDRRGRWQDRMSLLSNAAKGSKIIVTTRSSTVSRATDAFRTHTLKGLSEEKSWSLFKRVAFTPEQENDPRWTDVGREIVKKCRNVPLAIKSIGSLLFEKHTLQEWESFKDEDISILEGQGDDYIMNTLKLSYDQLPSSYKHCFAYCALFPKDAKFEVQKLIYLWIAQGYIKSDHGLQRIEQEGESCFMYLLRRGFFQEAMHGKYDEITYCKMHDLIHDLAQNVAGEESIMLSSTSRDKSKCTRHVSVRYLEMDESWVIPASPRNGNKLRSFLLMDEPRGGILPPLLDQLFANFKLLRTLSLSKLGVTYVSSSIRELKHLRYLDLSFNKFERLPDSMTGLLNLITLDISFCARLEALPDDLRKLINLRYLSVRHCWRLKHMPPGMGEMTCLQYLSDFKAGKAAGNRCGLDALAGLGQLRGMLTIEFERDSLGDLDQDGGWKIAKSLQGLKIVEYPGKRIPDWGSNRGTSNDKLAYLQFTFCRKVKYLPSLRLRCLPYLKRLTLFCLRELEFVEDGVDICTTGASVPSFFPHLESLVLEVLPKLRGWSRKVASETSSSAPVSFPLLSTLKIDRCSELESIPLCPRLRELHLNDTTINSYPDHTTPLASSSSLQEILSSPHLHKINIYSFDTWEILLLAPPKLQQLLIGDCSRLKEVHLAHPGALEKLVIFGCPQLELLQIHDQSRWHLDWDSFTSLRELKLKPLPPPEKLPHCLRHRQALGQLQITEFVSTFIRYWDRITNSNLHVEFILFVGVLIPSFVAILNAIYQINEVVKPRLRFDSVAVTLHSRQSTPSNRPRSSNDGYSKLCLLFSVSISFSSLSK